MATTMFSSPDRQTHHKSKRQTQTTVLTEHNFLQLHPLQF